MKMLWKTGFVRVVQQKESRGNVSMKEMAREQYCERASLRA